MKKTRLVNEIIKNSAPHVFRELNALAGFDFEKPFEIVKINGSFTIKKLLKAANAAGFDKADNIAALTKPNNISCFCSDLHFVTIEAGAVENVKFRSPSLYKNNGAYLSRALQDYYTKGSFEEARKSANAETWLILQKSEHRTIKGGKKRESISTADRYNVICTQGATDGHGAHWISSIQLERTTDNGSCIEYKSQPGNFYNPRGWKPETIDEIIDKSGYLLHDKRENLSRRAAQLRAERAKAAYQATDNADKVRELETLFEAKKKEVARAILAAGNYEEMKEAERLISDYRTGLTWAASDLCRYKERTVQKAYNSIEASTAAYEAIKAKLQPSGAALDTIRGRMKSGFDSIAAAATSAAPKTATA